ncbi:MAG TPA: right-handed parallel beta-helix repeat-containing protein, partial [Chloroflexota bacterium]|nr:right-handed parallel beta-helix repeat-containing protein [Chloroflexota bacterium]
MKASIRCRICRAALIVVMGLIATGGLTGAAPAQAGTIYVSTTGSDAGNGLTWGTAKKTVQAGLNAAVSGDQVWVATGTYVECITLKAGVALYGGFAGTETDLSQRNWKGNQTILDGNRGGSVVTSPSGATGTTQIDGFTIRGGSATLVSGDHVGGGIYCNSSSPMITNNIITGNSADDGSGIYCYSSSPTIANNTISGNSASYDGGGICCGGSSCATIIDNTISRNSASYSGGAIYCSSSSPMITNNTITSNSASSGGGIFCSNYSSATITNNRISGNSASSHGGG